MTTQDLVRLRDASLAVAKQLEQQAANQRAAAERFQEQLDRRGVNG